MSSVPPLPEALDRYFAAERRGAGRMIVLGLASLLLAGGVRGMGPMGPGAALVFAIAGVAQLVGGATVLLRVGRRASELGTRLRQDPGTFTQQEEARMVKVMRSFYWWTTAEIVLLLLGLVVALVVHQRGPVMGAALATVVEMVLTLPQELLSRGRAHVWLSYVRKPRL